MTARRITSGLAALPAPPALSALPLLPVLRVLPVVALAALALLVGLPRPAAAQIRASEPASVSQTVDGTRIDIEYFRPRARGRAPLFGHDAVVWEQIWTPGANWSTNIAFEKPIEIDGVEVEPGRYSIWMIMSAEEFLPEEMILHPDPKIFHTNPPDLEEAILRIPLSRTEAHHTEMLTWDFEEVRTDGATLTLRWGTLRIPLEIGVRSTTRQVATPEEAAPVVGAYQLVWTSPEGESTPPFSFVVTHAENGTVHGDIEGFPGEEGEWLNSLDLMLLPMGDRIFGIGEAWDGELTEVWPGAMIEFELTEGPSATLQFRDDEDRLWGTGQRTR